MSALHSKCTLSLLFSLLLLLHSPHLSALTQDGIFLLSFKYAVLDDPLSSLSNWNYDDSSPCSWNGVICMGFSNSSISPSTNSSNSSSVVISLILPNSKLLGSIPADLALIPNLRHLDLSSNSLNGTLPSSLFNSSTLRILSLANNELSGTLPARIPNLASLQQLNLSDNALAGPLPAALASQPNLTSLSLSNNYLAGPLPTGVSRLRLLDLSSNLFNGSIPPDLPVADVDYLNLSYNKLGGDIPADLAARIPPRAAVDFSFNNLTGGIPQSAALLAQRPAAYAGNTALCGKPLADLCTIPSSLSNPPNASAADPHESPPAFAAIPKTPATSSSASNATASASGGFKPATIAAIVIGDLGGIGLLFVLFLYIYQVKKRNKQKRQQQNETKKAGGGAAARPSPPPPPESKPHCPLSCCLTNKAGNGEEDTSATSGGSSETETSDTDEKEAERTQARQSQQGATLVTVDGELELEMETLLKASAYILGATGSTIVYKAVLADGTALAVRRIGESSAVDKFRDFEAVVRSIAKFRHPNLVRVWGFYWGPDEKLFITDYAPNGSLANISISKKLGSSPFHLNWEARLRIARGVARGLAYIHEKKSVHGNIKPSNILLGTDMDAKISDFGLDRLLFGDSITKPGSSARLFGSKRSQSSAPELSPIPGASPLGPGSSAGPSSIPYQAPESLKNLKPNPKWDVYSFGMLLLELIAGRVFSEEELSQWNAGFVVEEKNRIVRMADPSLRGEIEGKEEALLSCFKLGFACASIAPQRRPGMRDVVMLLDRVPSASSN